MQDLGQIHGGVGVVVREVGRLHDRLGLASQPLGFPKCAPPGEDFSADPAPADLPGGILRVHAGSGPAGLLHHGSQETCTLVSSANFTLPPSIRKSYNSYNRL